jgi:hypothetical protein
MTTGWEQFEEVRLPSEPAGTTLSADEEEVLDRLIADQLCDGWELIREEAEDALKLKPDDPVALDNLAAYRAFKTQKLIVAKPRQKSGERTGTWTQHTDGRWCIRVTKSTAGDMVTVKRANGKSQRFELVEQVAPNVWTGMGK